MKSWSDIVEDAKESWNDLTDDVKEELRDIDWEKIFDSDTFKKIASLVVGDKIFAYSLLRYHYSIMDSRLYNVLRCGISASKMCSGA